MKRVIIFGILLVISCAASAYVSYSIGYQKSHYLAQRLRYGDVVVSLDALNDLRAGQADGGIKKVEAIFFSDAQMVYHDPEFQQQFAGITNAAFSTEVRQYLASYHTNRSAWTPVMVRLESDLAKWP